MEPNRRVFGETCRRGKRGKATGMGGGLGGQRGREAVEGRGKCYEVLTLEARNNEGVSHYNIFSFFFSFFKDFVKCSLKQVE